MNVAVDAHNLLEMIATHMSELTELDMIPISKTRNFGMFSMLKILQKLSFHAPHDYNFNLMKALKSVKFLVLIQLIGVDHLLEIVENVPTLVYFEVEVLLIEEPEWELDCGALAKLIEKRKLSPYC